MDFSVLINRIIHLEVAHDTELVYMMMKRLFFSLFVSLLCITNAFAQQQMAVLSHKGEIKAFYGVSAYQQAIAVANHGDIITLSSGVFDAADIDKTLNIRGSGMENDINTGRGATFIQGDYSICIDNEEKKLFIEGICFNGTMVVQGKNDLDHLILNKCKFTKHSAHGISLSTGDSVAIKCIITNCKINNSFCLNQPSLEAYNSFIRAYTDGHFYNCIGYIPYEMSHCHIHNSVAIASGSVHIYENNSFSNSIIAGDYEKEPNGSFDSFYFKNYGCPMFNVETTYLDDLFKNPDFDGDYMDKCDFILADKYNKNDIGMYGGVAPYTPILNLPTITNINVDKESDEKGLLGVGIEVSGVK